jgi:hypothetical protein
MDNAKNIIGHYNRALIYGLYHFILWYQFRDLTAIKPMYVFFIFLIRRFKGIAIVLFCIAILCSVSIVILNIVFSVKVDDYQYYCITINYIIPVGILFVVAMWMFVMSQIIFNKLIKEYFDQEKLSLDSNKESRKDKKRNKTNSTISISKKQKIKYLHNISGENSKIIYKNKRSLSSGITYLN